MQVNYWKQRWADGRTGWHLSDVNPRLIEYWQHLGLDAASRVLVPLCGKTLDLMWLVEQGHEVIGVEASELAVDDLPAHENLDIRCSDFFEFADQDVDAWYDRAALVALSPELRVKYFAHLAKVLPPGARGLLISFEYPKGMREGPPFSVTENQVFDLCGDDFKCESIARFGSSEIEAVYVVERI
ncbi:MAG: thiopurine S-methyltransferase [Planctomycetes bacterium]|nr:thiopurine S-methyltransferase [Planctomycetota bacterium]